MIKLIIFDLWKTLAHSTEENPVKWVARKVDSFATKDTYEQVSNILFLQEYESTEELAKTITKQTNHGIDTRLINQLKKFIEAELMSPELYPETEKILKQLKKKYKIALLSNTENFSISKMPPKFLELFDRVYFSYETGVTKPNPQAYEKVLEDFDVMPEETAMVGDNIINDVKTPISIGMKGIHIKRDGTGQIKSLEEIEVHLYD